MAKQKADWAKLDESALAAAFKEIGKSLTQAAGGLGADMKTALEGRTRELGDVARAAGAALDAARAKMAAKRDELAKLTEKLQAATDASRSVLRPLNNLTDRLTEFGDRWKKAVQPFADFQKALDGALAPVRAAREAFGTLTAPVRMLAALPGQVAGAVAGISQKAAGMLGGPAAQLQSFFGQVQSQVQSLVAGFNPGAALKFQMALDNMNAALGATLVPVLGQFAGLATAIGGALNGLSGEGKIMIAALVAGAIGMGIFTAAALALEATLTAGIVPLLSAIGGAAAGAFGGLALATGQLKSAFEPVMTIFGGMAERLGGVISKFAGGGAVAGLAEAFAEVAGVAIDLGASVLNFLMPSFNAAAELARAMAPAFLPLVGVLTLLATGPVLVPVVAAVTLLAKTFEVAAPYIIAVTELVMDFGKTMFDIARQLLSVIGIDLGDFGTAPRSESKDPAGLAAKNTSTTDVSSVLRAARESSFKTGLGGQQTNWGEKTATGIGGLTSEVQAIKNHILTEWTPAKLAEALANHTKEKAKETARSTADAMGNSTAGRVAGVAAWGINPIFGLAYQQVQGSLARYGS